MITDEERNSIVNEAVEKALLKLPEIVGNLMMNYAAKAKTSEKFYERFPEFSKHRDVVASAVERIEEEDPTKNLEQILNDAVPEIRRRLKSIKGLDMSTVKKPDTDFSHGEF